jgi:hypothetical protein
MIDAPGGSVIALSRAPGGWRDRLRRYQVVLDGEQVAAIKRGERIDLPVSPGTHSIFLKIDWARSPRLQLDIAPGQVVTLECAPTDSPPLGPGAETYIDLRRTS